MKCVQILMCRGLEACTVHGGAFQRSTLKNLRSSVKSFDGELRRANRLDLEFGLCSKWSLQHSRTNSYYMISRNMATIFICGYIMDVTVYTYNGVEGRGTRDEQSSEFNVTRPEAINVITAYSSAVMVNCGRGKMKGYGHSSCCCESRQHKSKAALIIDNDLATL